MKIGLDGLKLFLFTCVGLACAVLLYLTLAQQPVGSTHNYSALMTNASGLTAGSPVRVAGVDVGRVNSVNVVNNDQVRVDFDVNSSQTLTNATNFLVRYQNLLGQRYVELQQQPGVGQPLAVGATIPIGKTVPALDLNLLLSGFHPLFNGLDPTQVNALASNLIATLQGEGGSIQQLLAQTSAFTNGLADHDQEIGNLITTFNSVLGDVDQRDTQMRNALTGLQTLVSGLNQDRGPIVAALNNISLFSGSLSSLLADVRPPLAATLNNLNSAATLLNDNSAALQNTLTQIPQIYPIIARAGSHGSFFNFYLCSVQVKLPDGTLTPVIGSNNATARCH